MAASHLWVYLCVLTLALRPCLVQGADPGVIAGCTVGVFVVVAVIVIIVILLLIRRKKRLGRTSFRQKPSVYENVSPNGTIISVRDSVPDVVCQEPKTKKSVTKRKSDIPVPREKKTEKPEIKTKPAVMKKPEHLKSKGTEYVNSQSVVPDNNNTSTAIPIAGLQEYMDKLRKEKGFDREYQKLPSGFNRSYNESQKEENKGKNKFTGYYPYDYNRVVLSYLPDDPSSSYINASFITGYKQRRFYIAAQAPKKRTVVDFWRMIWEQKCGKVVMLTNLTEAMKIKCEPYWDVDSPLDVGNFVITVTKEAKRAHWTIRDLTVKQKETKVTKSVLQFHFTAWPDHGVPEVTSLMEFVWRVRKTRSPQSGPLLVHCSAGIGRTGAFISIDYLLDQGQTESTVDVFDFVSKLRGQRKDMIQTKEQYECVYDALLDVFTMGDTTLTCGEFRDRKASNTTFSMGNCSIPQFVKMLKTERQIAKSSDKRTNRLWITDKDDHFAVVVPSYRSLCGYIVSEIPSKSHTGGFWKTVDDQDANVLLLLPEASKHLARLCPVSGKSLDFHNVFVSCNRQDKLDESTVCRNLQITPKADSSTSVKLQLYSSSKLVVRDIPQLITKMDRSHDSEVSPQPTAIVFGPSERKLAAMVSILSTVLDAISLDEEVEIYNTVRTVTQQLQQDITQSDLETLVDIISLHLPTGSMYANFSCV